MSEQGTLPEVPVLPEGLSLLSESELQDTRKRLIEADGDMDKAGISLEHMRNVLYTTRHKANPMQDTPKDAKPKATKVKTESINKVKLSGDDVNSFLG